jgi:hypothetical protein
MCFQEVYYSLLYVEGITSDSDIIKKLSTLDYHTMNILFIHKVQCS